MASPPVTTLRVTSADDATRILGWYALRWRIEEYFRVLKSGCKVEELQHHEAERLERAMAIKMVVGWRIQLMVQLGRETPELPGDLLFSDGELRVLATFARSRTLPAPTRLGDAVGLVARLGGWLGRKRDPPGAQLLWHGYTQLVAMNCGMNSDDLQVQPARYGARAGLELPVECLGAGALILPPLSILRAGEVHRNTSRRKRHRYDTRTHGIPSSGGAAPVTGMGHRAGLPHLTRT